MKIMWVIIGLCLTVLVGFLIFKPVFRKSFFDYISRDKMPIWLSILLAFGAAYGTYVLAPLLNQDFEFQKNRSAHLLQTVNEINKLSVDLAISVRRFNDSLFYEKDNVTTKRGELLDKITELQWRLIDVDVVIKRAQADDSCVDDLSKRLDTLRNSAMNAKKPEDQEDIIKSSLAVAKSSRTCVGVLYKSANLDTN